MSSIARRIAKGMMQISLRNEVILKRPKFVAAVEKAKEAAKRTYPKKPNG